MDARSSTSRAARNRRDMRAQSRYDDTTEGVRSACRQRPWLRTVSACVPTPEAHPSPFRITTWGGALWHRDLGKGPELLPATCTDHPSYSQSSRLEWQRSHPASWRSQPLPSSQLLCSTPSALSTSSTWRTFILL